MKKNKILKLAYVLLMITIFVISNITLSIAATKEELNQREEELNTKIDEKNKEVEGVKEQISKTMLDIRDLSAKIGEYENEILALEIEIDGLNEEIEVTAKKLQEQEEKFQEQQDLLNKRLVALYESGSTSYLDMLLSSDGLTEFISKYYLIETLAECDTNLLNSIEKLKNEIAASKLKLEEDRDTVENNKETIEAKKSALDVVKKEKNSQVAQLNAEEKNLQDEIDVMQQDARRIQDEIAAILAAEAAQAAQNSEDVSSTPSSSGYINPIAGMSKSRATTYRGHTGIDFPASEGTPIRAVKAGTVTTSTALYNSNGTYRSYGEYIMINHHDGTATLYAHGVPGSRTVRVGDTVSQGETIMLVGKTGKATGPHLHFEVRLSSGWVNPMPYLP